jgi:NDP-sugar pyrophosphorylase family protein
MAATTTVEQLFDLSSFPHRRILFGHDPHPWHALDRLRASVLELVRTSADGPAGAPFRNAHFPSRYPDARFRDVETCAIAADVVIEPFAVIFGPVFIDQGALIGPCAFIRGPAYIGRGCVVGHCSEIKASILLPGAKAPHRNGVHDSILGREANLGDGAKLANLRRDRRTIRVEGTDTRRRKLGAMIGDGAFLACNASLNPGVIVRPRALIL